MSRFAQGTSVTPEKTQAQISAMLRKVGCSGVMLGYEESNAFVAFIYNNVQARLFCPLSSREPENRRRWRVLRIIIQAKFEVIQCGIKTFEEEFFGDLVMPNGKTVTQNALPLVTKAIAEKAMPSRILLLPEATNDNPR